MSRLSTAPVYGDPTQLGCKEVFVRFKENKLASIYHRVDETLGAELLLVNINPQDGFYSITYINGDGMVMKRISYSRESILEATITDSICRISKPPATVTPIGGARP